MSDAYVPTVHREWDRIAVADGVELAYAEAGSGPAVVFVPGWTMSGEVFEHRLAELASSFRIVTFDPSHGRSTVTAEGNSYPQQGRDLLALLDDLDLAEVHLVGWSYGAWRGDRPSRGRARAIADRDRHDAKAARDRRGR